jgi:transcriptional regulator with XRE-family HTH domain
MASCAVPADVVGWMANERLRAALLESGVTPADLAEHVGVDHKTVERWIRGRLPYRKHRYSIATRLKVEEKYLWPDALSQDQVAAASESEIVGIYPHRSDVPRETWMRLFDAATSEIGILVYAGMFLAEDGGAQRLLTAKARAGVRVRVLLGDPDSPEVAERGHDEEIGEAMAAKVRNALVLYKPLRAIDSAEVRLHRTVLYNSIYRADNQLLVNTHVFGVPAYNAPTLHLRKIAGGEIASTYLESFEHVWNSSIPVTEE